MGLAPRFAARAHVALAAVLAVLLVASVAGLALAHPMFQGTLDVAVRPAGLDVRARVTVEEALTTDLMTVTAPSSGPGEFELQRVLERHAEYLAAHLHVSADGHALAGVVREVDATAGTESAPGPTADVVYTIEFRAPGGGEIRPAAFEISHDVLADVTAPGGASYDVTYVVNVRGEAVRPEDGLVLTSGRPLRIECSRSADASPASARHAAWDYLVVGVRHILGGWDHILFVAALVLAARRAWDLVKIVTAFTVAHTCTLTVAALGVFRLPSSIVEPMIAASIVYVAVENAVRPDVVRGRRRLAVAFFFGLFHGLGFAGGLADAMQGLRGTLVVTAIAAFSVGVEIGHQIVVLPVFSALRLAERARAAGPDREVLRARVQKVGSAAVALGGAWYLVAAISG